MKKHKNIKRNSDKPSTKERIIQLYRIGKGTVVKNLWLELLAMVVATLIASGIVFFIVSYFINQTEMGTNEYVTYTEGREYIQNEMFNMVREINGLNIEDMGMDINYEELEYIVSNLSREEAIEELKIIFHNNDDIESKYLTPIIELYDKLSELINQQKWSKVDIQTIVGEYYQSIGIDKQILLTQAITEILQSSFNDEFFFSASETYLVDGSGKIMYQEGVVNSLNLINVIQKINNSEENQDNSKFRGIYPITINNEVCYLYNESTIEPVYHTFHTNLGNILGFIAATGVFILVIFRLTRDKVAYIQYLSKCLGEISKGNLNYDIEVIGEDELAEVAKSITHMENELRYQIDSQIRAEKSKNELVTNVAHDLRTPLTSIIGYIGLVKDNTHTSQADRDKYLDIAYNKAENLKVIIEDLFELTKLHQQVIKLKKQSISLGNLLNQLIEELMPLANDKNIEIETYIDTIDTTIDVDITKITRVFENLIENAIKYCPENEVVYIELRSSTNMLYVAVSNPFENIEEEEIDKFFERFYRGDKSRNSLAGGSGLGLAIAKNIVELHGGQIKSELNKDLISFKVALPR